MTLDGDFPGPAEEKKAPHLVLRVFGPKRLSQWNQRSLPQVFPSVLDGQSVQAPGSPWSEPHCI